MIDLWYAMRILACGRVCDGMISSCGGRVTDERRRIARELVTTAIKMRRGLNMLVLNCLLMRLESSLGTKKLARMLKRKV